MSEALGTSHKTKWGWDLCEGLDLIFLFQYLPPLNSNLASCGFISVKIQLWIVNTEQLTFKPSDLISYFQCQSLSLEIGIINHDRQDMFNLLFLIDLYPRCLSADLFYWLQILNRICWMKYLALIVIPYPHPFRPHKWIGKRGLIRDFMSTWLRSSLALVDQTEPNKNSVGKTWGT